MKGNPYRKRYIVVESFEPDPDFRGLDYILAKNGNAKRKFTSGRFAVYLTNQFLRENVTDTINKTQKFRTLVTSGTIRKCKKTIESLMSGNSGPP
ncbi:MAG: hypothetical protein QXV22_00010 [Thermoplasmataceae archaeon]